LLRAFAVQTVAMCNTTRGSPPEVALHLSHKIGTLQHLLPTACPLKYPGQENANQENAMNSLRDMMETTFVAAAFAERNMSKEAGELLGRTSNSRAQAPCTQVDPKAKRQRPTLKA